MAELRRRLDGWRRRYGGRGRRIPEELWREAAEVARREGVGVVARALQLRQERLERLERLAVEASGDAQGGRALEFVEIALPSSGAGVVFVQFEAPDGRRLQLEVPPAGCCDVGAMFAAFVGAPR